MNLNNKMDHKLYELPVIHADDAIYLPIISVHTKIPKGSFIEITNGTTTIYSIVGDICQEMAFIIPQWMVRIFPDTYILIIKKCSYISPLGIVEIRPSINIRDATQHDNLMIAIKKILESAIVINVGMEINVMSIKCTIRSVINCSHEPKQYGTMTDNTHIFICDSKFKIPIFDSKIFSPKKIGQYVRPYIYSGFVLYILPDQKMPNQMYSGIGITSD